MQYKTDIGYRKKTLTKLLSVITKREDEIIQALYDDFRKPAFEAVLTETNYVISDLQHTIKNINSWAKRKKVWPSILNFPSSDYIYKEPYGDVLVIAPWNYPYQLALCPLIAAVAAGNKVILKPSELTPATAGIIELIVAETFDGTHVEVYQGGPEVSEKLLERRWDYIFFTGSVAIGKVVAKAAAKYLTPVTLELGGKNPCIVDETADISLSAKRIVWGKFINAGQTCIAPDYILVKSKVRDELITALKSEIKLAYGDNPKLSPDYTRIVNAKNWERLVTMIELENIAVGGESDKSQLYIAPTVILEPHLNSEIMKDEIFGPLLPVISYQSEADLDKIISKYEKPLSLYVFTGNNAFAEKMIEKFSFGGGCINDTIVHFSNSRLPFGGVGNSGMGAYHGQLGFDTFSHKKSIVNKGTWLDLPMRYAPYGNKLNTIRKLLKWF